MSKFPKPYRWSPKHPEKYAGDPTQIWVRSGWEQKAMLFFDNNPDILEWSSEEIVIPYLSPVDNRIHRYFPDFVVVSKSSTGINNYLVEVKPKAQTLPPKKRKKSTPRMITEIMTYEVNQAKWAAAQHWCKIKNMTFLILTEDHIKP